MWLNPIPSHPLVLVLFDWRPVENLVEKSPSEWSKLDKIRYLLDQWNVIFDPAGTSPFGVPGDGSGVALLPLMSRHPSVMELGRCLEMLFVANPGDYRHLAAYRCGVEWRVCWIPTRIRGPHGKMLPGEPKPERRRIIPSWLDMRRVEAAELFLEARFRGEVFIPGELWDALNTPAVAA